MVVFILSMLIGSVGIMALNFTYIFPEWLISFISIAYVLLNGAVAVYIADLSAKVRYLKEATREENE